MDNMKARAFCESETPDMTLPKDAEDVARIAKDYVASADRVARAVGSAVKTALYGNAAKVASDATPLRGARDRLWTDTHDSFFALLNQISQWPVEAFQHDAETEVAENWRNTLKQAGLAIFDDAVSIHDAQAPDIKRIVDGRRQLVWTLTGYGRRGQELFDLLELPTPETKSRKSSAA